MSDLPVTRPPTSPVTSSTEAVTKPAPPSPSPSVPSRPNARPPTVLERWESRLTSMPSIASGIALSLALTIHSLFVQLPKASLAQVVAAREEAAALAQQIVDAGGYELIDQASLSNQVVRAESFLIPKRDEVVGLMVEIEKRCRETGWKPDLTVRASTEKSGSIDGISIIPATLRLYPLTSFEGTNSSYERLIGLLNRIDQIPRKVAVVSMSAVAERDASVSFVVIELQFWTSKPHEQLSPK